MDRYVLTCRCLACGHEAIQPARWYHEQSMLCSCGGQFDPIPFEQAAAFIQGRAKALPETVRVISDVQEDSDA